MRMLGSDKSRLQGIPLRVATAQPFHNLSQMQNIKQTQMQSFSHSKMKSLVIREMYCSQYH